MGSLRGAWMGCASFVLASVQAMCVAAVALSGVRVLLGMGSLLAAGAVGPAHGFHRDSLRIPILAAAGILAVLNLLLLWNENRVRRNPAAQWRIQPLTSRQRRGQWTVSYTHLDVYKRQLLHCQRGERGGVKALNFRPLQFRHLKAKRAAELGMRAEPRGQPPSQVAQGKTF